ncbi:MULTISPECIES: bifunctional hydroxymethylpyrimidine kinase/phosphomethylpyrimidine kinase [Bacillus]|uniref:bifunctional hydroxymethylpyrimidine kinase/phosphomethylpyrimidine kinase n=1 Tax=Bacillus TaxID=1386 RepID=UPI0002DA765B|nr:MULTISPECIES: bifunctional hydroxymethylpyrimidine kinase/phosphomethylpyrimidine kinase [Bacillus]
MKKVLSIAGSDCSGGAGIQADIKTITAHNMYAMSAITALTAQNTTGVYAVQEATPEFVGQQLDCIMKDIFPDSVKIGMVSSPDIIQVIVDKLIDYRPNHIVVDPVMISTSGSKLLNEDAMDMLITKLIPLASLITPNIPEAECLSGMVIHNKEDMQKVALNIAENYKGHILIKGGHLEETADDLLYSDGQFTWFPSVKIDNSNTHGTGCTLSSAIACHLADGCDMKTSIQKAKQYITGALLDQLNLGAGNGPLNHCYTLAMNNELS